MPPPSAFTHDTVGLILPADPIFSHSGLSPLRKQSNQIPQGLPPAPRSKPIASNHAGEEDDDLFLQRADSGDRRLHHGTSRDIFK